jgi:hypothetical protein
LRHIQPCLDAQHDCAVGDREIDDVARGDDGFTPGSFSAFEVSVDLMRVRMRAAQGLAPDHAGHGGVGGELGAAGDLVHAVGTDGALAIPCC